MNNKNFERTILWILLITMTFMFCVSTWSNNSSTNFSLSLLDIMDTTEQQYKKVIKDYRQQVYDLKIENAELKSTIKEMEENK